MKLVTFRPRVEAAARLGILSGARIVDVAALGRALGQPLPDSMLGLIDTGPDGLDALIRLTNDCVGRFPPGTVIPAANVRLLAPIPRPRKTIFGIGPNHARDADEGARSLDTAGDLPAEPVIFSYPPTAVIGPGEPIRHDTRLAARLDGEVALAAVIGTTARRVAKADAPGHVFGYAAMIGVSARDDRRAGRWSHSRGMDGSAPFGPCIVTADEIPDPQGLDLWLSVNGVEKRRSNTRHMIFDVAHLVADISRGITLEPGDIIAAGTPEGAGAGRSPREGLRPGDVVAAGVEGIGTLRHPVVDASDD